MINTLKIILLTILLLGNLFVMGVSIYFWKSNKSKANRTGLAFISILEIANIIVIGGALL